MITEPSLFLCFYQLTERSCFLISWRRNMVNQWETALHVPLQPSAVIDIRPERLLQPASILKGHCSSSGLIIQLPQCRRQAWPAAGMPSSPVASTVTWPSDSGWKYTITAAISAVWSMVGFSAILDVLEKAYIACSTACVCKVGHCGLRKQALGVGWSIWVLRRWGTWSELRYM